MKPWFIAVAILTLSALGGIMGFGGGIVWCLIEYPDSPQAPLFGIFITGPIGVILGFIASVVMVISISRNSNHDKNSAAS